MADEQKQSDQNSLPAYKPPVFGSTDSPQNARAFTYFSKPLPREQSSDASSVFVKPKHNRPEHHRPVLPAMSRAPQNEFTQKPFQQPRFLDESMVPKPINEYKIHRPQAPQVYAQRAAYPPVFSSSSYIPSYSSSSYNPPEASEFLGGEKFGDPDLYAYVDPAKAFENIKALLDGSVEDEDDKSIKRRLRKKAPSNTDRLEAKLASLSVGGSSSDKIEEEEQDDGTVDGLSVKLLPHQVAGVTWMLDRETGAAKTKRGIKPKGGILADDMGLGKTLQTLALMLINPRSELDVQGHHSSKLNKVGKSTLIVAPLALIKQWEAEIKDKVSQSPPLSVCIHHGPSRTKRAADLKKFDVVITTYQILASEHAMGSEELPFGCFGVVWYRVVLDEAHVIKNRNTKAAKACCALQAEYRWCLSGTPMQNNLDELQSLIAFLRIKPYSNLAEWRKDITEPMKANRGRLAMKRLQVFLQAFMKRRTKDILKEEGALHPGGKAPQSSADSSERFKITERKVIPVMLEFSPAERDFYDKLEQRIDVSLGQMLGMGNGLANKTINYVGALVLLLRLRQVCNHPQLVAGKVSKDDDALSMSDKRSGGSSRNGDDADELADMLGGLTVRTKNCDMCMQALSQHAIRENAIRCESCSGSLAKVKPAKSIASNRSKPRRKRRVVLDSDDDESEEEEGDWLVGKRHRPREGLGKAGGTDDENAEGGGEWLHSDDDGSEDEEEGSASDGEVSADEDDSAEEDDLIPPPGEMMSTKIQSLMRLLKKESGKAKFIVFSQFTSMLDLIEPFLKEAGLVFTRYDGSMRNDLREASLDRLRHDKRTRILLCSLKCGSLGLNLTAASRVVILEPFWNPFVEEQAIDRVHRLNQTVDVVVYKFTIAHTVEEKILELQEHKRELAKAAIGEGGKSSNKLGVAELMKLFRHDWRHEESGGSAREDRALQPAPQVLGSAVAAASQGGDLQQPAKTGMERPAGMAFGATAAAAATKSRPGGRGDDANDVYGRRW